MLTYTLLLVFY